MFNLAQWLVDRQVDEGRSDHVAIGEGDESLTYAQLLDRVRSASAGLADQGVRREERVALVLRDSIDFTASFLGAVRIGAVPVPVNPLLPAADIDAIVADARAAVVLRDGAPSGDGDPGVAGTTEESPGFWLCTSGTTGLPKLAMHRHADGRLVADGYAREVLQVGPGDVCYSVAPQFHAYGLGNSIFFPFAAGARTVVEPTRPPTPAMVARIVATHTVTLFFCVPTFYAALLASDLPSDAFASVRCAVSAGESLPADLFTRFRERFGVEVLDGIGSTEMTHIFVSNRAGSARAGTSGTPVGGYDVEIRGDDGAAADAGDLWVRGETAATGYWCRSQASRRTFVGEWTRTGDVYSRDADGFYTYLGRSDDMFKVGGEWVSPAEVEAVLIEHDAVLEAAVVAETDPSGLLKPVAFVVRDGDCDGDVLTEHCRARLAGFKRPRRYEFVDDLPKTVTGKIQRFKLRA